MLKEVKLHIENEDVSSFGADSNGVTVKTTNGEHIYLEYKIIDRINAIRDREKNGRVSDWYYVYRFRDGAWTYDRTCGTEYAAQDRVVHLKTIYEDAKYLKNEIIQGAYV